MKKTLLSVSALVFGGVVLAQTPSSEAALNAAKSNSLVGASANYGVSEQYGDENKVRVRQAGGNQEVYTYQDGVANQSSVIQVAEPQDAPNAAITMQIGSENQATSVQYGGLNGSVIAQGLNDDSSNNNKALVVQGSKDAPVYGNISVIEQDGEANLAATVQGNWFNNSEIIQEGIENEAYVHQDGESGQDAYVDQLGERNVSTVHQLGAATNYAATIQTGVDNSAYQYQNSWSAGAEGNYGTIIQGDTYVPGSDDLVGDKVGELGNGISTEVSGTNSIDNGAVQMQYGNGNEGLIVQFGENNLAKQEQDGLYNAALIGQSGENNYANQYQEGDFNAAGIVQMGEHNKAYQRQYGEGNMALSYQEGDHNKVNTYQEGNYALAVTEQIGTGNQALVIQEGQNGQVYGVFQEGCHNSADIMQLDATNCGNFDTDVKCEFPEITVPNCPIEIPDLDLKDPCPGC